MTFLTKIRILRACLEFVKHILHASFISKKLRGFYTFSMVLSKVKTEFTGIKEVLLIFDRNLNRP